MHGVTVFGVGYCYKSRIEHGCDVSLRIDLEFQSTQSPHEGVYSTLMRLLVQA